MAGSGSSDRARQQAVEALPGEDLVLIVAGPAGAAAGLVEPARDRAGRGAQDARNGRDRHALRAHAQRAAEVGLGAANAVVGRADGRGGRGAAELADCLPYLARAYGLAVESVHWEPGGMPTDVQWEELEALVERHPATWMLWEGPPSPETAARLEELGICCVVFDPCGGPRPGEDFLSVLQANIERLRAAGCGVL